jgi:hypothetical protein
MEGLHGSEPIDELNNVGSRLRPTKNCHASRPTSSDSTQVKLNNIEPIFAARIGSQNWQSGFQHQEISRRFQTLVAVQEEQRWQARESFGKTILE